MRRYLPPSPTTYRLPPPSQRIVRGALLALPAAFFYLGIPFLALGLFQRFGVPFPYDPGPLALGGIVLTSLTVGKYLAKPTRAFGPVAALHATALIAYLIGLAARSTLSFSIGGANVGIGFSMLLLFATAIPLFSLGAALVTTAEDLVRPTERYPFDFPAGPL